MVLGHASVSRLTVFGFTRVTRNQPPPPTLTTSSRAMLPGCLVPPMLAGVRAGRGEVALPAPLFGLEPLNAAHDDAWRIAGVVGADRVRSFGGLLRGAVEVAGLLVAAQRPLA